MLNVDLACARFEQISAAHDIGDVLLAVIDSGGKMERKDSVRAAQHDVARFTLEVAFLRALQGIDKAYVRALHV